MRPAIFWDFTQRRMVISCRRFGTTCKCYLQESSSPKDYLMSKDGNERLCRNVGKNLPFFAE